MVLALVFTLLREIETFYNILCTYHKSVKKTSIIRHACIQLCIKQLRVYTMMHINFSIIECNILFVYSCHKQ